MKKVLVVMVGIAFVVGIAVASYAADTVVTDSKIKVTEKKNETVIKGKETVTTEKGKEVTKTKIDAKQNELVVKEKSKIKMDGEKEKVKEVVTTTTKGTETEEKVLKTFKDKSPVKKEKVTFVSYSDKNGGTITVIKDKKEMEMQAKLNEGWKNNSWKKNHIQKVNKEVTITSSYDPKLNQYIVDTVE